MDLTHLFIDQRALCLLVTQQTCEVFDRYSDMLTLLERHRLPDQQDALKRVSNRVDQSFMDREIDFEMADALKRRIAALTKPSKGALKRAKARAEKASSDEDRQDGQFAERLSHPAPKKATRRGRRTRRPDSRELAIARGVSSSQVDHAAESLRPARRWVSRGSVSNSRNKLHKLQ